ncbi:hypothetical protein [Sinorhizobium chiapasense]|uniref:Uncharacterized protein n=1 Tax=Sinorhizobium chiapasense TaxID=501572 RepID=A0ABZ2BDP7_9HYPH
MSAEGYYAVEKRTLAQRLWKKLGFGERHLGPPDDAEDMAPGWMATHVTTELDWRDRFRVLVSGRVRVRSYTQTDVIVKRARSYSVFSVLAPGGE